MLSGFCPASFRVLFCSVVLGSRTDIKLLDRVFSGASFLTGGVFECDLAHRRSVAVLCMLYKIRCTRCTPFIYGALPEPYVPVRVSRGAVIANGTIVHLHDRYITSQCHRTFIFLSVSLWNDFGTPVFDGVGLAGFKSRANAFLMA